MRLSTSAVVTMVIATGCATCFAGSSAATGALAAVRARGKLIMVCFPHQDNPFIRVNVEQGPMKRVGTAADFKGIDVDLMSAFAKSIGVELELRPISTPSYAELIPALLAGQGDLIASSFSNTPDRARQVDFTDPYFEVYQVVLVRKDSGIAAAEDLVGKTAAVVPGTIMEERIRNLGVPEQRIHREGFTRDALLQIVNRDADFTVMELDDYGTSARLLDEFSLLKVAFRVGSPEAYAVAVPKGSDLRAALNGFLAEVKASGELAKIIRRNVAPQR